VIAIGLIAPLRRVTGRYTDVIHAALALSGIGLGVLAGELDQILQRAAEPIKLRHDKLTASAVRRQQRSLQLRPGCEIPRRRLEKISSHPAAARASC
jgi:hypothetical protein